MRTSLVALTARQTATDRVPLAVLALIVAIIALLSSTAPRALGVLYTAEVQRQLSGLTTESRDLVSTSGFSDPVGVLAGMRALPATLPDDFGDLFGEPSAVVLSTELEAIDTDPRPGQYKSQLVLATDPDWASRITITIGSAPRAVPFQDPDTFELSSLEFTLSTASAKGLDWSIGEVRTVGIGQSAIPVVLTGTFEPVDPDDPYWLHNSTVLEPSTFDDGNSTPIVTGTAFAPTNDWLATGITARNLAWFPLDTTGLDATAAHTLLPELRKFASTAHTVDRSSGVTLTFRTEAMRALETADTKIESTTALLLLIAAGPVGAALAVLALGVQVVAQRRRATRAILRARGASPVLLRAMAAAEGAAIAVPAAALGVVAGAVLLPGAIDAATLAVPVIIAVALGLLSAIVTTPASIVGERNDLTTARPSPRRWIVEAVVVVLAIAALALLLTRDFEAEPNPLVAATPLLLSLATCLLVLRLLPLPLGALMASLRRRRGLVGFLGAARAVRDPAAGLAPVLSLIVAVSVVLFSGILLATIDRGIDTTARGTAGADLQVTGAAFDEPVRDDLSTVPGIAATAALDNAGGSAIVVNGDRTVITLLVAEFDDLRAVGWSDVPADGAELREGAIPLIVSHDLAEGLTGDLRIGSHEVTVAAIADDARGIVTNSSWAIADAAFVQDLTSIGFRPRILLVDLEPGADSAEVASAIDERIDTPTSSTTPGWIAAEFRGSPIVGGLTTTLLVAMLVVALLCVFAIVATTILGGRTRRPLLTLLATLGTSGRQARALALWEITPVALTAIIAGSLLGIALPFAVSGSIDLRPFTGSAVQPSPVIDPVFIAVVVAGFAVVAVGSVLLAVAATRRSPYNSAQEAQ